MSRGRQQSISTLPVNSDPSNTSEYKIITLGNAGIGKSTLIASYAKGTLDQNFTHQEQTTMRIVQRGQKLVQVKLWDTAGQERYDSITQNYYRGAHGCLLCFDITNEESFADLKEWYDKLKSHCEHSFPATILVGTKGDQRHSNQFVQNLKSQPDCLMAARNLGLVYREVDCQKQETIEDTFDHLINLIEHKRSSKQGDPNNNWALFSGSGSIKLQPAVEEEKEKKSFCQNLC